MTWEQAVLSLLTFLGEQLNLAFTPLTDFHASQGNLLSTFALPYDNTQLYAVGDLCVYHGTLYRCIIPIEAAELWNADHWTQVTIGDVLNELRALIDDKQTSLIFDSTPIENSQNPVYSNGIYSALLGKLDAALKGAANGLAELNENGRVPTSQLPSYVDDVLEFSDLESFPLIGESSKIYLAIDTQLIYRWAGTTYAEISPSLALGETASTAYRGDRGAIAYNHALNKGAEFVVGLYKIATNSEGHVIAATPATKSDVGLNNVDNTSDLDKPISTSTQAALDGITTRLDALVNLDEEEY